MDLPQVFEAMRLMKEGVELIRSVSALMPSSPQKDAAHRSLDMAERSFRLAEAQIAESLGYQLCQCTFPPQIALLDPKTKARPCPNCGRDTNEDYRSHGGGSY